MRRTRSAALVTAAVLLATAAPPTAAVAQEPAEERSRAVQVERALASYEAMQRYLYADDGSSLYLEHFPRAPEDRTYSFEWPFSQAHVATLDLTGLPGRVGRQLSDDLADREVGQERYWNAEGGTTGLPGYDSYPRAPYGDGGDMFYDDNEWVALADVQEHLATGDPEALERAREIFELVVSGWDDDPTTPRPAGSSGPRRRGAPTATPSRPCRARSSGCGCT